MRITSIVSETGLPASFSYDVNNPTYYTEMLSFWLLKNMAAMEGQSFQARQDEDTDYSGIDAEITDYMNDIYSWLVSAIADINNGITPSAFTEIIGIATTAGLSSGHLAARVLPILISALLNHFVGGKRSTGEGTDDLEDLINKFEDAFLTPGNVNSSLVRAINTSTTQTLRDIVDALAAVGLHITCTSQGTYAEYSDDVP